MKMKKISVLALTLLMPVIALAQDDGRAPFTGLQVFIMRAGDIVEKLLVLVVAIALLAFMWGLAKFIFKANDTKENEAGKNLMKWGLVALFVMISVWGIIYFVQGELGIQGRNTPDGWWKSL